MTLQEIPREICIRSRESMLQVEKILPLGMAFPFDVGVIENAHAEYGDPADAMVINACITYPGEIKDFSKQHNQQLQDFFINYM